MIDLDSNATTPLLPEVLESMLPWLSQHHANPSGSYQAAKHARVALEQAREHVAALIGAQAHEIIFTSGGTESVNSALRSLDHLCKPGVAVCSSIEHSAVLRCVESLTRGHRLVPVSADGQLDLDAWQTSMHGAAFASLMSANNETGVIQPVHAACEIAHHHGIPFHTDAIQQAGKLPIDVRDTAVDLLSLSAHKFHGPKGIGALYVRSGLSFHPLLHGGGQEHGRRSGTENLPAIVGMGTAARCAMETIQNGSASAIASIRDAFEAEIFKGLTGVTLNGCRDHRLPNTSHLSFSGCEADGLLILLDQAGIQCSAGSACMTGKQQPSHVQLAMGIPAMQAKSSLRFSFSKSITHAQALEAATAVIAAVQKIRRIQGPSVGPVSVYTP